MTHTPPPPVAAEDDCARRPMIEEIPDASDEIYEQHRENLRGYRWTPGTATPR